MAVRREIGDDESMKARRSFGDLLRDVRERRRLSQLALAQDAAISTRHLSFLETGRSTPSREMVIRLSRVLDLPLRERNAMLHAAGFAPAFAERPLSDPALAPALRAVELVLKSHDPFPALAIDRHWHLVAKNRAIDPLFALASPSLLTPPVNVLMLTLHPRGLAPRILNLAQWRAHLFERLGHQIAVSGDPALEALLRSLRDLGPSPPVEPLDDTYGGIAVPLTIDTGEGVRSFLSTTTVFGTSVDVTLSEITLECFFPI
jgi:transcriptional regulator with XRE-family HTH domain